MDSQTIKVFLLKVTARCNINCTYCYEYNLEDQSWRNKPSKMSFETLRKTSGRIREHVIEKKLKKILIIFHGGEPLLAGKEFFEYATNYLNEDIGHICSIQYAMQSNGLLIDDSWIRLFKFRKIRVGISIDGFKELNDKFRLDHKGYSTFEKVEETLKLISTKENEDIAGGLLCVIQPNSNPVELFNWFLSWGNIKLDFLFPHFNHSRKPIEPFNESHGFGYGLWLSKIFEYWWVNDLVDIKVRLFEDIIHLMLGGIYAVESLGLAPVQLLVIQTDGGYEAVDSLKSTFDGAVSTKINVFNSKVTKVFQHNLISSRTNRIDNLCLQCKRCRLVNVCGGGYIPHRFHSTLKFLAPSIFCKDLTYLIEHIEKSLLNMGDKKIVKSIQKTLTPFESAI